MTEKTRVEKWKSGRPSMMAASFNAPDCRARGYSPCPCARGTWRWWSPSWTSSPHRSSRCAAGSSSVPSTSSGRSGEEVIENIHTTNVSILNRRFCMSTHSKDNSCPDMVRELALNVPPVWDLVGNMAKKLAEQDGMEDLAAR